MRPGNQRGNQWTAMSFGIKFTSVYTSGPAMRQNQKPVGIFLNKCLTAILLTIAASTSSAQEIRAVPVNIFGDGDPFNGVEDSRQPVTVAPGDRRSTARHQMNAGTISCDGKFRGTAMVIDAREFAYDIGGVVLATAAHVLYNLDKKKLFGRCYFHFMGWEKDAGYRARINLKRVRMGDFDPNKATGTTEFGEGDWAFLYLSKPWKRFNPDQSIRVREFSFSRSGSYRRSGGEFRLLAFDSSAGVISESRNCMVVESGGDDLGGGAWKGQLLDDCDSADGASGGGIIAVVNQAYYLIGIRNGSHWSELVYPPDRFPSGPPDGSAWDRRLNTNFGRAIDTHLLHEINDLIQSHIE